MAKDEARITNNHQVMDKIIDVAKKVTHSKDTSNPKTVDKIDEIVTILETHGKKREQGQKAHRHGNDKDYDEAVKR